MPEVRDWKLTIYFEATDDEAHSFYNPILDAATRVLGCPEELDPEHVCPRFQFAGMRPVRDSRRRALSWVLHDLWSAIRRGEVG